MKNTFTQEEQEKLKEARVYLMQIKAGQSKKFVLKAIAWISRRLLKKIDNEYFKPRVEEFMKKHNITKMEYTQWHFQTFEMLKANEGSITADLPPEVKKKLV